MPAWTHNSYQGYDTVGTWYTASSTPSASSVGFRPYRQQSDAGQTTSQWSEAGSSGPARGDYDDGLLYHGHGSGLGSGQSSDQGLGLGHDPYYSQQSYAAYQGLGQRYGHNAGPGLASGGRHPDQHLANSMVQLDKSGSTRTELA